MRILIVTSQFPLAGDPGRGRPVLQTVQELAKLATVRVVSPVATYPAWARPRSYLFQPPAPAGDVSGYDVEYVSYNALPLLTRPCNGSSCGRALRGPIAAFAPDVVLSYWLYPDAYGAVLAARRAGVPVVAGARGSDLRVRDAISRHLTRRVVAAAQRLLVVSDDLAAVAHGRYDADPARVRVIRNGCDAAVFRPADRAEARLALGVAHDAELVLYVGRLVPEKGLRELLDAAGTMAASRRRMQVVLIGDGPMRGELQALLSGELGTSVRLAGALPPASVAQWMAAADLVTLPSHSEGHPNVLVEALACGRPVVATRVGGIPEIVDGACGLLVPVGDDAALAVALGHALDRQWDETALSTRFGRDWSEVARDTLQACAEAIDVARDPVTRGQQHATTRGAPGSA